MYHDIKCHICGKQASYMALPMGQNDHYCIEHGLKDVHGDAEYALINPELIGEIVDSKAIRLLYCEIFHKENWTSNEYLTFLKCNSINSHVYDPDSRYYYSHPDFPLMVKDFWKWWCNNQLEKLVTEL